jgi:ElaB/YqjD/DUF883 family membrane-anchored ribosome-binding protein
MPFANRDANEDVRPTLTDRIADAVRDTAHFSHKARLVKSVAKDAGEDGVHAAKRLMKRARRMAKELEDVRDEAAYYVKRQPFKVVVIAACAGLLFGVAIGWIGGKVGPQSASGSTP